MSIEEVDVVCVCREEPKDSWWDNIERVPARHVVLETSTPLSLARCRAIRRVKTPWFVFIDDDMRIGENWWSQAKDTLEQLTRRGFIFGAIHGETRVSGLGSYNEAISAIRLSKGSRTLEPGERGWTHNTLMLTEAVSDWVPNQKLPAYEDYLLTQHVLSKGYVWYARPLDAVHHRTWEDIKRMSHTTGRAYAQLFGRMRALVFASRLLAVYCREKLTPSSPARRRLIDVQNIALLKGLLSW
jgi:hypothetical protein